MVGDPTGLPVLLRVPGATVGVRDAMCRVGDRVWDGVREGVLVRVVTAVLEWVGGRV